MAHQHILVVDDDARILASIRRALIYEGYQVETAQDGVAALQHARERLPDLIVLDVMLPGVDGLELCRRFRADGDVPILMLTAKDATADRVRGLDSGADDYLVKPFAYEELLARVRALLRRGGSRGQGALRFANVILDLEAREVSRGARNIVVTVKEFALLTCFARHPRRVLTRDQILEAVWSGDLDATSNVVDVYIGYLRQKLEEGGESRLIQTVRGVGYVLREE